LETRRKSAQKRTSPLPDRGSRFCWHSKIFVISASSKNANERRVHQPAGWSLITGGLMIAKKWQTYELKRY